MFCSSQNTPTVMTQIINYDSKSIPSLYSFYYHFILKSSNHYSLILLIQSVTFINLILFRWDFFQNYTLKTLNIKIDKWGKFIGNEDAKQIVSDFMEKKDKICLIEGLLHDIITFFYFLSAVSFCFFLCLLLMWFFNSSSLLKLEQHFEHQL